MANATGSLIKAEWIDRAAIGLSGLCLIHCLASVLLLALMASVGGLLLNPLFHEVGLVCAIGLGLAAFARGLFSHGQKRPALIGGLGLSAMAYALSLRHGVAGEVVFTVIGVALVATGHMLNRRAFGVVSH